MGFSTTNVVFVLFAACPLSIFANEHNHIYEKDDEVNLWMSTVGPYHNRQETYPYYSLPFCKGRKDVIKHQSEKLAEALQLSYSGLDIKFKEDVPKTKYCQVLLNNEAYEVLVSAVKNQYYYIMYLDNLPIAGTVGEAVEINGQVSYYIWTHKKLDIGYNGKQIVDANLTSENKVELTPGARITQIYEVNWKRSSIKFQDRFDKYSNSTLSILDIKQLFNFLIQ